MKSLFSDYARMKTTTKILHLFWAGFWSLFLLWASLDISWNYLREEPYMIAMPIAALSWLPFAIGLFFNRAWAWYGSFAFTVLSLFVAFYVTWGSIAIVHFEGGSFYWELFAFAIALAVVVALLYTRHQFLKDDKVG